MSDPYRSAAIVPFVPVIVERQGELMSKWNLNGVSLEWTHGDPDSVKLGVQNARAAIDVDELRELQMMIARLLEEVT